jgi:hypothetical protein
MVLRIEWGTQRMRFVVSHPFAQNEKGWGTQPAPGVPVDAHGGVDSTSIDINM